MQIDYEKNDTTSDYVPSNKTQYDLPQNCTEYYKDKVDDPSLITMLEGYSCPTIGMNLRG